MPANVQSQAMPFVNLARFDLVSIRLAVYCADCGSLTAAARRANLSLSQASYRLATLESSLESVLFHRRQHGLESTAAGKVLVERGRELLQCVDTLARDLHAVRPRSLPAAAIFPFRPMQAGYASGA